MWKEIEVPSNCRWCGGETDGGYPAVTCLVCGASSQWGNSDWGLWHPTAETLKMLASRIAEVWDSYPAQYELVESLYHDLEDLKHA